MQKLRLLYLHIKLFSLCNRIVTCRGYFLYFYSIFLSKMSNFAAKFKRKMNKTAQHIIDIQNVSKRFGEKTALNNINLFVRKGEFMTILGPSGCGKLLF